MATRHERVVLELDDRFSTGMARAAAATALLDRNLDDLDGTHVNTNRNLSTTTTETDRLGDSMRRNGAEIDKFSGRLRVFADAAAILGPGLVPIGAVAVPAVTALAGQLGFAAIGAGSLITAFQGVGDTIKAVNEAALEPTAANLEKAREAMSKLAPEAQEFVTRFQEIRPVLTDIRDSAAAGWFPGLTESLDSLIEIGPRVGQILHAIGESGGALVAEGAEALSGPEWGEFLSFVQNTAPEALDTLGRTIGNVARGLAELWMAFDPLNTSVNDWLLESSRSFAEWADGLSATEGFQDFMAYLRESGPQVADALGSIANAVLQILEAAAPLGGPVLAALTATADAIAAIADSKAGPAILAAASAMAIMSRATAGFAAISKTAWAANISGAMGAERQALSLKKTLAGGAAAVAGFAFAQSGAAEATGLTNTAMGTMAGAIVGGPYGAALGAGIGMTLDFKSAQDDLADATRNAFDVLNSADITAIKATLKELTDLRYDPSLSDIGGELLGDPVGFIRSTLSGQGSDLLPGGLVAQSVIKALQDQVNSFDMSHMGEQIGSLGGSLDGAAAEIEEFAASFRDLQTLLDLSGSIGAYEESLDNLTASIKENGDAWDQSGPKGRANMEQARENVDKTILRFNALTEAGKDFAAQRFMDRAIAELEAFAGQSDAAEAALRPLIRALKQADGQNVNPEVRIQGLGKAIGQVGSLLGGMQDLDKADANPKVEIKNAGTALGQIAAITGALNGIDRSIQVTVNAVGPGRLFDVGGYTGAGNKHEVAGLVHRDEVVLPKEIVRRDASMLRNRYGFLPGMSNLPGYARGGYVSPSGISTASSQGIGNAAYLDIGRFGSALHDLTQIAAREYDSREVQLDRTDEQFQRILKKREAAAEKEFEADKSRLKAMLDTQRAFEEQVSSLFKSDIFAKGDEQVYAVFPDGSRVLLEGGLDNVSTADSMYYQQSGATYQTDSGFDPLGGLQGDVANIQEAMRLYRELRRRGFDGPAFRELAASADVQRLREMVALSNQELQQIESTFNQRDQLLNQLGNQVGNQAGYAQEIAALRADLSKSREQVRQIAADLIHLIKDEGGVTNEIVRLQHVTAQASRGVGQELAEAFNTSVSSGATGRGRR